jgi:hypothetical protein
MIDLEFDDRARAEKMLAVLENVWQTPRARGAVSGDIKTAIFEQVEAHDL